MKDKRRIDTILGKSSKQNLKNLLPAKKGYLGDKRKRNFGYQPLLLTDFLIKNPVLADKMKKAQMFKRNGLNQLWDKSKARNLISSGPVNQYKQTVIQYDNSRKLQISKKL